jgi:hypothetical protein
VTKFETNPVSSKLTCSTGCDSRSDAHDKFRRKKPKRKGCRVEYVYGGDETMVLTTDEDEANDSRGQVLGSLEAMVDPSMSKQAVLNCLTANGKNYQHDQSLL